MCGDKMLVHIHQLDMHIIVVLYLYCQLYTIPQYHSIAGSDTADTALFDEYLSIVWPNTSLPLSQDGQYTHCYMYVCIIQMVTLVYRKHSETDINFACTYCP